VNCDLMINKNSRVIKLGTCTVNVLYQVFVNYYIFEVRIIECILSVKLKSH